MNRPQFSSLISINNDSTLLWRRLPEPRSKSNPGGNHQCLACTETCSGENLQSKWTLRGNIRNLACYFFISCFQVTQQGSLGRVAMGTFWTCWRGCDVASGRGKIKLSLLAVRERFHIQSLCKTWLPLLPVATPESGTMITPNNYSYDSYLRNRIWKC